MLPFTLLFLVTLCSKLYILWQIVVSREETDPNMGLGSGQLSVFGVSQQLQENVPGVCLKNVCSSVGEEFRKILNFPGFGGGFFFFLFCQYFSSSTRNKTQNASMFNSLVISVQTRLKWQRQEGIRSPLEGMARVSFFRNTPVIKLLKYWLYLWMYKEKEPRSFQLFPAGCCVNIPKVTSCLRGNCLCIWGLLGFRLLLQFLKLVKLQSSSTKYRAADIIYGPLIPPVVALNQYLLNGAS